MSMYQNYKYKTDSIDGIPTYDSVNKEYLVVETLTHHILPVDMDRCRQDFTNRVNAANNFNKVATANQYQPTLTNVNSVIQSGDIGLFH